MRLLAALSLLALAACDRSGTSAAALVTTRDSTDGILRIRHTGEAPNWILTEVASIGTAEEGPSSLARIRSLLLGPDGGVFIADAGQKSIREFGPDGSFRRAIGRDGAGPGEYDIPYSLGWIGDTLAVLDPMNVRVGLFDRGGGWLGQWPSPPLTGGSSVRLFPSGDGALYLMALERRGEQLTRLFVGHRPSGQVDSIPDLPRPTVTSGVTCERPSDGAMVFFDIPFSARQDHVPGPGGTFVVVDGRDYRIVTLTPAGDTVRIVTREVAPVPISDLEWEAASVEFTEAKRKYADMRCDMTSLPRAATKPPVESFFLADDGSLWVDRWVVEGKLTEVYDSDGNLLGAFPTPARSENVIPTARGQRLAVATMDADGIPVVKVYTLR